MNPDTLLLPPSTRLIHIGPYKTGTTALQNAFHANRAQLEAHGVHYAGHGTQPTLAALAVVGRKGRKGDPLPRPEHWTRLVDEVRAAGTQRVVISSEFLCSADDAATHRVVRDLSSGPVHVVLTLRPITKIAPSQWQQYIQNGVRVPYGRWLRAVFGHPPDRTVTPTFWQRHDHATQIRRWANAVGPDNLTVVVVDDNDKTMLPRTFEAFVGLPDGLLVPPRGTANRSLTQGESELVRLVNEQAARNNWSDRDYARFVREGVVRLMKTGRRPAPGDRGLSMPDWALPQAADVGREVVRAIESTGVHVVGDPDTLQVSAGSGQEHRETTGPPRTVPATSAALAVLGAIAGDRTPKPGAEVAAAVSLLSALGNADSDTDESGAPRVRIEQAAQAVIGTVEGHAATSEFVGLPPVDAKVAALASVANTTTAGSAGSSTTDLLMARRVLDSLRTDTGWRAVAGPRGPRHERPDKKTVEDTTAAELLKVVARRGRRRARHLLHR